MKKFTKKFLSAVILIAAISLSAKATNVSGGIYSNTTWTLANSPYIVVDSVVVFPSDTLTIEPGVVVEFDDHKNLEIRGYIIALGTLADSITFTSNSASPIPGIWNGVSTSNTSAFNYCNFRYAYTALSLSGSIKNSSFSFNVNGMTEGFILVDSCSFRHNFYYGLEAAFADIKNCNSMYNNTGIYCRESTITNCISDSNQIGVSMDGSVIENCTIRYNQVGIGEDIDGYQNTYRNCVINHNAITGIELYDEDSLCSCEIKYNGIGVNDLFGTYKNIIGNVIENDSIGIRLGGGYVYCNRICSNTSFNIQYYSGVNYNYLSNNYWCTTDSSQIAASIYDGYDNISLGLVTFMPIDTIGCYLTGCNLQLSATVTNATCDTCHNGSATAHIANGFAPYIYTWFTTPIQSTQTATGLASGIYTFCVADGHGCTACNSGVFVDSSNCTGFGIHANAINATCSACNDGSASVSIAGGTPPYNYTWYTVPIQTTAIATGLPQGTYSVCVTDLYGCSSCDSATVSTGNCSAHFNLNPDTILHHYYAVNMASGVAPLSYSWNWGDGSPFDTVPYPNHTYASAGFYVICLTITDSAGCVNTYCNSFYLQRMTESNAMVYVNVIPESNTGIVEQFTNESVQIFPNPVIDQLTLILPTKNSKTKIRIVNLLGQTKFSSAVETQKSSIDVSSLTKGIYILEITTESKTINKKIIKQ